MYILKMCYIFNYYIYIMDLYNFIKIFIYKYNFPIFSYFLSEYHAILMNFYLSNVLQSIIVANFDAQVILNVTNGSTFTLALTSIYLLHFFSFLGTLLSHTG